MHRIIKAQPYASVSSAAAMSVVRVSPTTRDAVVRLLGELSPGGMSSEALARIGRLRPAVVEATLAQLEAAGAVARGELVTL